MNKQQVSFVFFMLVIVVSPLCFSGNIYRCQRGKEVIYQSGPCVKGYDQKIQDSNAGIQIYESNPLDPQKVKAVEEGSKNQRGIRGEKLILTRSDNSHFYIEGTINGVGVRFLVDTGASFVSIPEEIADKAGLMSVKEAQSETATGVAKFAVTNVRELTVDKFKFNDVSAIIIGGKQALLGISVLKSFDITQKEDQLILVFKGI
jgi:aspartyl protease family protein